MMVNSKLYMGDKTCKTPFFYQTKSHKISQFSTKTSNKLIVKTKNYNFKIDFNILESIRIWSLWFIYILDPCI